MFAWGTLFYTIATGLTLVPIVGAYIDIFRTISDIDQNGQNPEEVFASFGLFAKLIPLFVLMMLAMLVAQSLLQAAFYRAYYDNDLGGAFPFRFGADEVRQGLSLLGYFGLFMAAYLGFFLHFAVFGVPGATMGETAAALIGILMFFAFIGLFVGLIWVMIAFSPATALTAYRGQVHVLAARHVSKGRFWALFGSLLVVYLITYVAQSVTMGVGMFALLGSFFDSDLFMSLEAQDGDLARQQFEAILASASFKISALIAVIALSAAYAFSGLMYIGPVAFFTRQWAEAHDESAVTASINGFE